MHHNYAFLWVLLLGREMKLGFIEESYVENIFLTIPNNYKILIIALIHSFSRSFLLISRYINSLQNVQNTYYHYPVSVILFTPYKSPPYLV